MKDITRIRVWKILKENGFVEHRHMLYNKLLGIGAIKADINGICEIEPSPTNRYKVSMTTLGETKIMYLNAYELYDYFKTKYR